MTLRSQAILHLGRQQGFITLKQLARLMPKEKGFGLSDIVAMKSLLEQQGIDYRISDAESETVLYHIPPEQMDGWKSYPMRFRVPRLSLCCNDPMLLVHSMERGFVTPNCSKCGGRETLSDSEFLALDLWVSCPFCRERMSPEKLSQIEPSGYMRAGNYGFACDTCQVFVLLAEMLPKWDELIDA